MLGGCGLNLASVGSAIRNLGWWCITGKNADSSAKSNKIDLTFVDSLGFAAAPLLFGRQNFLNAHLIDQVITLQVC
jgi:hypothetical protein